MSISTSRSARSWISRSWLINSMFLGGTAALVLFLCSGFRDSVAFESANEASHSKSVKLPVLMEAMSLSLYDADRFHYLLKCFCKERGYWIKYHGVMSLSEHRAGIQLESPGAACYWTVYFVDPKIRRSEVDSLAEVLLELVSRERVRGRIAWNLKLHESDLAVVLGNESLELDRATPVDEKQTLDAFVSDFCRFAEKRMKDFHYGLPFFPTED